ncbi:MAG: hypothetical protein IKJ82_06305 [Oscillospiraceae bacterium]|nr:hypothetical protein [Oscillospiraceae bacterium]
MKTPKDTEKMPQQRFLYVVFLSTPFRIGRMIRAITGYPYNHTALSLSPEMKYLYSFSRHYKNAPFYGGFTKESILRCHHGGNFAMMKICAVPIGEEEYQSAKKAIERLEKYREENIYNMISAACFPFKKSVRIKKSFTCAEFVLSMLKKYADIPVLKGKDFCSIKELSAVLDIYKIYEGSSEKFLENADWCGDTFPEEKGRWFYWKKTFSNNSKLAYRFVRRKKD